MFLRPESSVDEAKTGLLELWRVILARLNDADRRDLGEIHIGRTGEEPGAYAWAQTNADEHRVNLTLELKQDQLELNIVGWKKRSLSSSRTGCNQCGERRLSPGCLATKLLRSLVGLTRRLPRASVVAGRNDRASRLMPGGCLRLPLHREDDGRPRITQGGQAVVPRAYRLASRSGT